MWMTRQQLVRKPFVPKPSPSQNLIQRESLLFQKKICNEHRMERKMWNVKLLSNSFPWSIGSEKKYRHQYEQCEGILISSSKKIMKEIFSHRYLIVKAAPPSAATQPHPKSIIDYSTFYLLFLFISWNITLECHGAFPLPTLPHVLQFWVMGISLFCFPISIDLQRCLKALH